jgi:glycosyltransferase involved in cell wall biosynthesis
MGSFHPDGGEQIAMTPVYRSANTIREVVAQISRLQVAGGHELILVNDNSPDNTLAICRELAKSCPIPLTLIDLSRNFGEHNAVMAGLQQARGDYIVTMDDDLQNPPEEAVRLFNYTRDNQYDVVWTYYSHKKHALWRNLGSRLTNRMADVLLDKPKDLYLSSFRCITNFVARQITEYRGPFPYIDGLILRTTHQYGQLQVEHVARESGESNYTWRRLIRLWLNMSVNFSIMPLRLATAFGLLLAGFGFLFVVEVIWEHFYRSTPLGWGSLMAALLLFSGAQLLMLGIAGEYLGRIYLTINQRPQSVVRSIQRTGDATPVTQL